MRCCLTETDHCTTCRRAHQKLRELPGEVIDLPTFLKFAKTHTNLLYPAYAIQKRIIDEVCGAKFWSILAARRMEISNNQYIPVTAILDLGSNKKRRISSNDSASRTPPKLKAGARVAASDTETKPSSSTTKQSATTDTVAQAPIEGGRRKSKPQVQPLSLEAFGGEKNEGGAQKATPTAR